MVNSKVYFITGGSRGIGLALVRTLARSSPNNIVITSVRDISKCTDLLHFAETSSNVKILTLDVSDEDSINGLPQHLNRAAPEGIDVFISNAAIAEHSINHPVINVPRDVWLNHYNTNVLGPILITQLIVPLLDKRDTKQLIYLSSNLGSLSSFRLFSSSAYGQSKAALNHSVRTLSLELGNKGYTVIALNPGNVDTSLEHSKIGTVPASDEKGDKPHQNETVTTEESARSQVQLISQLRKKDNGKYYNWDGSIAEW